MGKTTGSCFKIPYRFFSLLLTLFLILLYQPLVGNTFVEISSGYNIAFGKWSDGFGKGFFLGGMTGFSFSEYVNPGIGGFIIFPKTGKIIEDEYKKVHNTKSISLFTTTSFLYLVNRMNFPLSEKSALTVEIGYGIHSQKNNATIIYDNFESTEFLSGNGPFVGIGFEREINFSAFDYIQPFLKCYYSPGKVYYNIIDQSLTVDKFEIAGQRIGVFVGITFINIGK